MSESAHMESLAQRGKDFLEHYGKKGMRWGVTTKSDSGGTSRGAKAKSIAKEVAKAEVSSAKRKIKYNAIGITVGVGYLYARQAARDHFDLDLPDISQGPEKVKLDSETEQWIKDQNLPSEHRDGGMFNPDAQLDTSRVSDADDPNYYGPGVDTPY